MARIIPVRFDDNPRWSSRETAERPLSAHNLEGFLARLLLPLRRRLARRAAIRELERLDRRLLNDIGIDRHDIADFVDSMLEPRRPREATVIAFPCSPPGRAAHACARLP